ncbi:MAG: GlsB/YeaQ/YmgE family stress response membrane protein [Chloroflexota bacterium]|nr:GlsB/YeaQ/YmgE family stress response membrane protein [Chloroflexota bacterium]
MDLTAIITWIVFGAIVGVIARFLMPGADPMGGLGTIILGIVGSFIGGFLSQLLFAGNAAFPPPTSGWVGSIVGALVALAIYRYSNGRRVAV